MSLFQAINQSLNNGSYSVGIAGAIEPGLPVGRFVRIPERMIKAFTYVDHTGANMAITAAAVIAAHFAVARPGETFRRMQSAGGVYTNRRPTGVATGTTATQAAYDAARATPVFSFAGNVITNPSVPAFDQGDIESFYDLNAPLYNDAAQGWDNAHLDNWLAARLAAVVFNCIDTYGRGEFVLVPTVPTWVASAPATIFATNAHAALDNGKLIVAGGVTNWYLINHTTGQGSLQTAAKKVCQVIGYPYPQGGGAANAQARDRAMKWYYDAAHPADKRNGVHAIIQNSANVCASQIPGLAVGVLADSDDFVKIRAHNGPIPAGHHKQSDTVTAGVIAAKSGLLPFAPGFAMFAQLRADVDEIRTLMGAAHQGADYLLRDDPEGMVRGGTSQNDTRYTAVYDAMGIFIDTMMHTSTLAQAPLFMNAAANKGPSYTGWYALCQTYAAQAAATPDPQLVAGLKAESGEAIGAGLIQTLQTAAAAIPAGNVAATDHARRVIARASRLIGEHYAGVRIWAAFVVPVGGDAGFTAAATAAVTAFVP